MWLGRNASDPDRSRETVAGSRRPPAPTGDAGMKCPMGYDDHVFRVLSVPFALIGVVGLVIGELTMDILQDELFGNRFAQRDHVEDRIAQ